MSKAKAYHIYILGFIILLGVLAFYLSCTSKSPTDAAAPSTETLAAKSTKGTTQTTTSSSTTTTIKPLSSAATSSTIITSRNLTTTSTISTTTSIPEVTTSIIQPANVKFCYIIGVYKSLYEEFETLSSKGITIPKQITIYNGDTVYVPYRYCLALNFYVHNVGGSPAENVKIIPIDLFTSSQNIYRGASNLIEFPVIPFLPNNSVCVRHPLSDLIPFNCELPTNPVRAKLTAPCWPRKFKLEWKDARWVSEFSFTQCWGYPNNTVPGQ